MNRTTRIAMLLGVLSLAATAIVWARQPAPGRSPAQTGAPRDTDVIAGPGRVEPRSEEIAVGAEVPGRIAAMLVDEGDRVVRGAVIARLEQRDYAARADAAQSRLRAAEAELARLVNGARLEERREADATAAGAQAEFEHAQVQVERARRLFEGGVIPREQLDAAERDIRVASARSAAAAERAAFVNAGPRSDERSRLEAAVALARATLDEARAMLAKTEVRSPITGIILRRHKLVGESVSVDGPSTAVVTVADTEVLRVRAEIDERDVASVRVGQRAWVSADAYGRTQFSGRVVRVSPMLGRKTVRTDQPAERVDTKVLEALIELDPGAVLPIGLRVDAFLARD